MIQRFDPVEPADFGSRAGIIHVGGKRIETPTRALNSSESRYKTKGITWKPYPNDIVEYVRNFDQERLAAIQGRNGAMREEVKGIRSVLRKNGERVSFFYPRTPEGTALAEDDVRTLLDLQGLAMVSLVSVPDTSGLSPERFERRIQQSREYVDQRFPGRECFPIVEVREERDAFRRKLALALDGGFKLVGFRFAPLTEYYPNFREISRLNREETWFHLHGVPRFWRGDHTTAQIHIPPFAGVDTMSLDAPGGGPRDPGRPEGVRRFDAASLGHLVKQLHAEMYGQDLGCQCPICENKSLDDFYREYLVGPKSKRPSVPRLRQHAFVHEVFASHSEFQGWRRAFLGGDIRNYIASKRFLRDALADLGMLP